jgi:hypothetical protein
VKKERKKIHHEDTKDTKKSESTKAVAVLAFLRDLRVFDGQEPECPEGHGWPKEAVVDLLIWILAGPQASGAACTGSLN